MSTVRKRVEHIEKSYLHQIYRRIVVMAMLMHVWYILQFWFLNFRWLSLYNAGSVAFYGLMLFLVRRSDRAAVVLVHGEVCLFVTLAVCAAGWGMGFQLLLISVASMVYFCPYHNKYIPYIFGVLEGLLYMGLYVYSNMRPAAPPVYGGKLVYIINTICSFGLILYAALISNLSARAAKRQLYEENASLAQLAARDSLTGLRLRRSAENILEGLWNRREGGQHFSVAMCDIDDFKRVNDTYGHECGDCVLRGVADTLCRIAGLEATVCRWGGEEFLMIFPGCGREEAAGIVRDLCGRLAQLPIGYAGIEIHVTVTFGVCDSSEAESVRKMIGLADKRLYIGKNAGKNQVVDSGPAEADGENEAQA